MIVRSSPTTLHLITQPDHAALAGRIMRLWRPLQDSPRRASILLAVEEHDNGWREPDEAPLVDPATGGVHDFITIPAEVRQAVWPRGIGRLSHDPWAAALVAQHALTVYSRYRTDAGWGGFFEKMQTTRDGLLHETPLTLQQLEEDYAFVRIGDLLSLIFCTQWEGESFASWRFRRDGDSVGVTPDAFAGATVPIAITAREIPNRQYTSDADLHGVLRAAPAVALHGTVTSFP
jgi:uncharacterized protein DUF3891